MDTASAYTLTGQLSRILREAFTGAAGPWTYFTDNRPGVGMLSTLESITSEEASIPVGPEGTTIAAHVSHVHASLAGSTALIGAKSASRDRTGTWTVGRVNAQQWKQLQSELRAQYERALQAIQVRLDWDEDSCSGALGAITHAAYHLGAIRQRLLVAGILRT